MRRSTVSSSLGNDLYYIAANAISSGASLNDVIECLKEHWTAELREQADRIEGAS